ncbi:MAG: hypothetical protein LBQ43_00150, partial [Holosporales bacterium]|nr:hypothetical protein [Holosporales bacterium]
PGSRYSLGENIGSISKENSVRGCTRHAENGQPHPCIQDQCTVIGGILESECADLIRQFFLNKRAKHSSQ